ncbi:MAG: DMT family transporter [Segniliparus sp.]|uniref:DMT family transporter n=1 Tax=Segniliparus sp. TaxID=2804064 RepID=UPI003F3EC762
MSSDILAIGLALFAALLFAAASAAQQSVAEDVPQEHAQGLAFVRSLVKQPRWWAGVLGDGGGYLVQAAALAVGSVLLVSPLLVASLLFALPISAALTGRPLTRRAVLLAMALTAALAFFVLLGHPDEGLESAPLRQWLVALIPGGLVAGACVVAAKFASGNARALLLGASTGVLFGIGAPLTKSVIAIGSTDLLALPFAWQTWALVAAGASGFYLQQLAFQSGEISASLPALTVAEPIAAALCGSVVFDEHLQVHGAGWALIAACVLVMVGATFGLARSQAASDIIDR